MHPELKTQTDTDSTVRDTMSMTAKFDVANQLDVRYDVFAASLSK